MALSPGTRLGHYDVTALIGEGGMGQVWQATDTQLNRQVALKILPDAFAADPDRLARFQREAQILASLKHDSRKLHSTRGRLPDMGRSDSEARPRSARGGRLMDFRCVEFVEELLFGEWRRTPLAR
jgi:serine/threonine protein kinase